MKDIDQLLRAFEQKHQLNWQYLIYKMRKHMDIWAAKNVSLPSTQLKQSHLPVIFNIGVDGTTAAVIGQRSMVIKQNLSQTIGELKKVGVIISAPEPRDKRIDRLKLTSAGKRTVLEAHEQLDALQQEYTKLVGPEYLQIAVEVIVRLINYHEELEADQ